MISKVIPFPVRKKPPASLLEPSAWPDPLEGLLTDGFVCLTAEEEAAAIRFMATHRQEDEL
jgi:hypothetical protein